MTLRLKRVSLANLKDIDQGRCVTGTDLLFAEAVGDCNDRPSLMAPRSVLLRFDIKPDPGEKGSVTFEMASAKLVKPPMRSKTYHFQTDENNEMLFAPETVDMNAGRPTIFDEALSHPLTRDEEESE